MAEDAKVRPNSSYTCDQCDPPHQVVSDDAVHCESCTDAVCKARAVMKCGCGCVLVRCRRCHDKHNPKPNWGGTAWSGWGGMWGGTTGGVSPSQPSGSAKP